MLPSTISTSKQESRGPTPAPALAAHGNPAHPRRLRIAILDDHPIAAIGLAACLNEDPRFKVVLIEHSVERFLHSLIPAGCDVAIVDYNLPGASCDGMNLIRRIKRRAGKIAVISLSTDSIRGTAYSAFRAGACGYLLKTDSTDLIRDLISTAAKQPGQFHIGIDGCIRSVKPQDLAVQLSANETEVLHHISQGMTITQTAQRLSRSKKTISSQKRSAMRKLGLADDLALGLYLTQRFESRLPGPG